MRYAWALAAVVILAGCAPSGGAAPSPGAVVDGFPLGPLMDPATVHGQNVPEAEVEALGLKALDERMPGHPAVVSAVAYNEDLGDPLAITHSGQMTVYVYLLADGSYHAAGVLCTPGGCFPVQVYGGPVG
jgi:hypothetical protein